MLKVVLSNYCTSLSRWHCIHFNCVQSFPQNSDLLVNWFANHCVCIVFWFSVLFYSLMFFLCISSDFANVPQILESACKYTKKINNNNNIGIFIFNLTEEHSVNEKRNGINTKEVNASVGKVTFNNLTFNRSQKNIMWEYS